MPGVDTAIKLVQPTKDEGVIRLLEDLLIEAKSGSLQRLMVYTMDSERQFHIQRSGRGSYAEDIGALEIMKAALTKWSTE